ncbi:MAG TPA: FecR domain-containing protein [Sandaracinaceae bacterium]
MIDDLLERVRDAQDAALDADASARDEVEARLLSEAPRARGRSLAWPLVGAAAAVLAAVVALAWMARDDGAEPITYVVEGGRASVGGFVAALEPATLSFSDGSRVSLERGTAARVTALDANGATIALERGALRASVEHREGTSWRVHAGPFAVLVTGTRFGVRWDDARAQVAVEVEQGSVRVEGACLAAPQFVRVGQRAELACEGWTIPSVASIEPLAGSPPSLPSERSRADHHDASGARPRAPAARPERGAPERARASTSDDPPAAESGPAAVDPPADEPRAQARLEAAQRAALAGEVEEARALLLAVRSDAASPGDRSMAAFLLGRLAFDAQQDYAEAERWFAVYESERPDGPLIREAMGRRLEALARSGDSAGARAQAERYLARFPFGPHARRAREILAE